MRNPTCIHPVVGIDVGTKKSQIAIVLADCEPESFSIQTTSVAFQEFFSRRVFTRIVLEAGGSSAWIARLLGSMGHHVVVVDSRQSGLKHLVQQKTDKNDAAALAFLALSPRLLREVRHAPEEIESDRALLDYRTKIVSQRTSLVNFTRGKLTSLGIRVPSGSTEAFPRRAAPLVPEGLSDTLELALRRISELTAEISKIDRMVARMLERYPVAEILQTIHGVGPIISARFILRVFDPAKALKPFDRGFDWKALLKSPKMDDPNDMRRTFEPEDDDDDDEEEDDDE